MCMNSSLVSPISGMFETSLVAVTISTPEVFESTEVTPFSAEMFGVWQTA